MKNEKAINKLTPQKIVVELDKHIVGQNAAKRAVAIALRDRWRRSQVQEELRPEITPKNILMIGPTGVGKTEITRRLAKLADAPFLKIEATKFTEIGYVGRDVESIVRDLTDIAVKQTREIELAKVRDHARDCAEEKILNILLPEAEGKDDSQKKEESAAKKAFREKLKTGVLDNKEIEIDIAARPIGIEIMAPPGMEEMTNQLQSMFSNLASEKKKTKKMTIKNAFKQLCEEEAAHMINEDEIRNIALDKVEQHGIVFIDEIDKIVRSNSEVHGADVSREGVQRDLLPIIEGCSVFTKYGAIRTDHVLFIASGAFHLTKPSDMIPELQGRLPIRVELSALSADDFVRILTEPTASLTEQYVALMATENVKLKFNKDGIRRIAEIAYHVNERTENIGARRLYTIMERLLEEVSFGATELKGKSVVINATYVNKQLAKLVQNEDLSHYIL